MINKQTGFAIRFSTASYGKLLHKSGVRKTQVLSAIDEIIVKGEYIRCEPSRHKQKNVLEVLFFKTEIILEGYLYDYIFNVKHTTSGKYIYAGNMDINKKRRLSNKLVPRF